MTADAAADRERSAGRLSVLAVAGESLLAAGAVVWTRWRGIPLSWARGRWPVAALAGLAGAGVLAGANLALLRRAPDVRGVRSIRRLFRHTLRPLFGTVGIRDVVVISLAAGVGEELLFRGALQAEAGVAAASVVFGLLHMGGRDTAAYGVWVMVMGAALGGLAAATGGLLAPVVAHAVYDAAAIAYCRWGPAGGAARRRGAPGAAGGTLRSSARGGVAAAAGE